MGLWRVSDVDWPELTVAPNCNAGEERKPFPFQKYATLLRAGK